MPASNADYWAQKIARNEARDKVTKQKLEAAGWKVFLVWECDLDRATCDAIQYLRTTGAAT
jgi:DNA mismatch endonuclease (patch repair protein)